jgi:hypothetical protein
MAADAKVISCGHVDRRTQLMDKARPVRRMAHGAYDPLVRRVRLLYKVGHDVEFDLNRRLAFVTRCARRTTTDGW